MSLILLVKRDLSGAQSRNRTSDTRIFNPLLYQLSYLGTVWCAGDTQGGQGCPEGKRPGSMRLGWGVVVGNVLAFGLVRDGDPVAFGQPAAKIDVRAAA
jgi:hypothetical protein